MRELSRDDLSDILYGAAILGAGGGGDLQEGFDLIDAAFAAGKSFRLVALDEVPDDALICTPYMLGAVTPLSASEQAAYARLPRAAEHPILTAYAAFENKLGARFFGTTPCELGGSNTAIAFFPAVMNDGFILDADPAGRAVPEITHSTYFLNDLPAAPILCANAFGETFVLENVADDQRAETLVRALSQVSQNDIAAIDHALPMHMLRDALIPGTISKALHLGQTWRAAKDADVAAAVAQADGGRVAFRGRVTQADYRTEAGFTLGEIQLASDTETFRITVKNENMAAWRNDQIDATVPDLICLFDTASGDPVVNPDCRVGQDVAVVYLPAPDVFRTKRGLEIFGPTYAGVTAPYVPAV